VELVEACVTDDPDTTLEPFDADLQAALREELSVLASLDSRDDIAIVTGAERIVTEASQREMKRDFWVHRDGAREWLRRHPHRM
jgi:hypothetical protein